VPDAGPDDVVRAFLEAERTRSPTAHFATGPLANCLELGDVLEASLGIELLDQQLNVRRVRLRSSDEARAVVDVRAFVVGHYRGPFGVTTDDGRFDGPFELVRVDGAWRVASIVVNGVSLPSWAYAPVADRRSGRVRRRAIAFFTKRGTIVVVAFDNDEARPIRVERIELEARFWRFFTRRWKAVLVPHVVGPGERWATSVSWHRLGPRTPLRLDGAVDGQTFEERFEPPPRLPFRFRLRRANREAWIDVFLVASGAWYAAFGGYGFVGIALLLSGIVALSKAAVTVYAGVPTTGAWVYGAFGAVEAAAGGAVMVQVGFGVGGTAIAAATLLFSLQRAFAAARVLTREHRRRLAEV
jgi:hypothetical protein